MSGLPAGSIGILVLVWVVTGVADKVREHRRLRLMEALGGRRSSRVAFVRWGLVGVAASAVLLAAGWGHRASQAWQDAWAGEGGLVLLLDVSRSMAARDVLPDRGSVARLAALRIGTGAPGLPVGVAAFADDAFLLLPPTLDQGLVALYAQGLDAESVSGQGSDLARGLEVALSALSHEGARPAPGSAVVVLSDGEGFQDEAALGDALARARNLGVVVHTVGAGTQAGAEVPGVLTRARTAARPEILAHIAERTGGIAIDGTDGRSVGRLLSLLPTPAPETPEHLPSSAGARWLILTALIALLAEGFLGAARSRGAP